MGWGLRNSLKGWSLFDLTDREVQLLILSMSANEIRLTQICQKGDSDWKVLTPELFPQLFVKEVASNFGYPQFDAKKEPIVDTDYFVVRPKKIQHPRLHQRYEVPIECSIIATNKQFKTTTIDLSEGGIYFKELIPDWVAGYFIVAVHADHAEYATIQLMCSLVEDQKIKQRVQIVSEENDPQYLLYKEWLLTLQVAD